MIVNRKKIRRLEDRIANSHEFFENLYQAFRRIGPLGKTARIAKPGRKTARP